MEKQSGVASGGGCRAGESFSNCLSSGVTSEGPHWVSERYLAKASCCFDHGTAFPEARFKLAYGGPKMLCRYFLRLLIVSGSIAV